MEVIDIGLNDLEPITLDMDDSRKKSVNFGPGIELLMNDKKKSSMSNHIDLGDLDNLEKELNELSGTTKPSGETKTLNSFTNTFFSNEAEEPQSNLGSATVESIGNTKTWDGFTKINEIPVDGDRPSTTKMTDREKRRKKRIMIQKIDDWYEKGLIKHNYHFNMDSNYEEVEDVYESCMEDKRKKDSIKLQGWWFMTAINSLEYANSAFNPFDISLDGWSETVQEDLDSYEDIFAELYDKYKGGKIAPELSLLLRIGFSAAVCNFTNKALSSATPGFNDVIRQSPELMRAFTSATVNTMSQSSPGFAMANNLMQDNRPRGPPPQAPVETRSQPPPQRPGSMVFTEHPNNRQDINAARGAMFQEQGVPINNQFQHVNQPPPSQSQSHSHSQSHSLRPEMQGPRNTDIDNILSGLKTRTVNIHEQPQQQQQQQQIHVETVEEDSMISIASLKDIQNSNMPKKSKRRQRSDKNIVSLDI